MRVLLVGGFGVGQSLQDLAEGFWHEGHQVRHVPFMGNAADPNLLREAMWSDAFDLIIGFCMFYSEPPVCDIIQRTRTPHFLWNFDSPHREMTDPQQWEQQVRPWTGVFCSADGDTVRDFYHRRDIPYASCFPPPAVDVRTFDHQATAEHAASLTTTFIGQCYDPRQFPRVLVPRAEIAQGITAAFGNKAQVFGNKWDPPRDRLQWHQTFYYWGLPTTTIGHHGEKDANIYFNGRDCCAMGVGAAYIVDRVNRMDMVMEEGVHALFYSNVDELIDKIRMCQADPALRQELGANARSYIMREHSQRRTAQRMIESAGVEGVTAEPDFSVILTTSGTTSIEDRALMQTDTDYSKTDRAALLRCGSVVEDHTCFEKALTHVRLYGPCGRHIAYAAILPKTVGQWSIAGVSAVSWWRTWRSTAAPGLLLDACRQVGERNGYDATVAWITAEAAPLWRRCGFLVHPNQRVAVKFNNRTIIEDYFWERLLASPSW